MEARLSDLEARLRSLEPLLAVVSQPPLVAAEPPSLARSLASASSPPDLSRAAGSPGRLGDCPEGGIVLPLKSPRLKSHQLAFSNRFSPLGDAPAEKQTLVIGDSVSEKREVSDTSDHSQLHPRGQSRRHRIQTEAAG